MQISEQEALRSISNRAGGRTSIHQNILESLQNLPDQRFITPMDISVTDIDIQKIKEAIANLPDVREDRVAALKARIENGTYNVKSDEIADLIIRRALADSSAL